MQQLTAAVTRPNAEQAPRLEAMFVAGETYEVTVRGHRVFVDQPPEAGGQDSAPTQVELFVGSLVTCVAFYAGRYLTRHGYRRDGLTVWADYQMATDKPARVGSIRVTVRPPADLPPQRWSALRAVAAHCTVHNSLATPPSVVVGVASPAELAR